ncbi:MAG: HAD family hydrolase [Mycobacteriales bacterium]
MATPDTALVDVDGTLVDTNYHHALSWHRAFRRFGIIVPVWEIHRHIGMGGDQLVQAVAGETVESEHGDDLRTAWSDEFAPMLAEIVPLPGAKDFLTEIQRRGWPVVLASSGNPEHTEHYLDLLDARSVVDAWTTSEDVDTTKPAPDLVQVAAERAGSGHPILVGDSPWDCESAGRIGVPVIGLLTGGFAAGELRAAGAGWVFESLPDLLTRIDDTPLSGIDAEGTRTPAAR